jgi:hypothetical protein
LGNKEDEFNPAYSLSTPQIKQVRMTLARIIFQGVVYVGSFLWARSIYRQARAKGRQLPGPNGVPLLGNIFDIPENFQWFIFTEWKKVYGASFLFK